MGNYLVEAKSRADLRRIARRLREHLKLDDVLCFPVVELLDILTEDFDGFDYEIVEDEVLPKNVHADTDIRTGHIRIKESVYEGACNGEGRDRMTIAHTEKQVVKIQLDYLQGPIWLSDIETGEPLTGIDLIDNDSELRELNRRAGQMFSAYYKFNTHEVSCWFNHEKEKAEKDIMLELIARIVARLKEINDGSFVIEDLETERLRAL